MKHTLDTILELEQQLVALACERTLNADVIEKAEALDAEHRCADDLRMQLKAALSPAEDQELERRRYLVRNS